MTTVNQPSEPQIDPRIESTLKRMEVLRAEHQLRTAEIIRNSGLDLISNSPSSFILPVGFLVLGIFGLALPVALTGSAAAAVSFTLFSSISVLGIKFAALVSPVPQSEFDHVQQMINGPIGLTFSAIGQITGGNQRFDSWGKFGSQLDDVVGMVSARRDVRESKQLGEKVVGAFNYYWNLFDLVNSGESIQQNAPLSAIRSSDPPMTSAHVETDPAVQKATRDETLKKYAQTGKSPTEVEQSVSHAASVWEAHDRAVAEVHSFEWTPPRTTDISNASPQPPLGKANHPETTKNTSSLHSKPATSDFVSWNGPSIGSTSPALNNGGSSTSDSSFEPLPSTSAAGQNDMSDTSEESTAPSAEAPPSALP